MHWFESYKPKVLLGGWKILNEYPEAVRWARLLRPKTARSPGLVWSVIMSGMEYGDGKRWIHLSTAMTHRLPNWEELTAIKEVFLGRDKKAIQLFVPASEHVNLNPYCLHLWHCIDGDGLPDFRNDVGGEKVI